MQVNSSIFIILYSIIDYSLATIIGFYQVMPAALMDEASFPDLNGSQSSHETFTPISSVDILSVNQLLESVS